MKRKKRTDEIPRIGICKPRTETRLKLANMIESQDLADSALFVTLTKLMIYLTFLCIGLDTLFWEMNFIGNWKYRSDFQTIIFVTSYRQTYDLPCMKTPENEAQIAIYWLHQRKSKKGQRYDHFTLLLCIWQKIFTEM